MESEPERLTAAQWADRLEAEASDWFDMEPGPVQLGYLEALNDLRELGANAR